MPDFNKDAGMKRIPNAGRMDDMPIWNKKTEPSIDGFSHVCYSSKG